MDLFPGRVDVLDQPIDAPLIIAQELESIAAKRFEHTESFRLQGNDLELKRQIGLSNYLSADLSLRLVDLFRGLSLELAPEGWNSNPPDQSVDDKAWPGEQENEEQPGASCGGAPPLRNVEKHGQPD